MKLRSQSYNFTTENMIKYQTVKKKYRCAPHVHQLAELLILRKGSLTVKVNEETEAMNEGQAALVLPFQPHGYDSTEYNEVEIFCFSANLVPEIYDTANGIFQKSAVFTPNSIALSVFDERILGREDFEVPDFKGALYLILNNFVKTVKLSQVTKYHNASVNIIKYISEHITEKITVSDIAKATSYTPNYISSIVNRTFGDNLASLLSAIRIEKAVYLLCNTDKTCYAICYECGFGSERDFFRKFKALIGITPTEYRKNSKISKKPNNGVVKYF